MHRIFAALAVGGLALKALRRLANYDDQPSVNDPKHEQLGSRGINAPA